MDMDSSNSNSAASCAHDTDNLTSSATNHPPSTQPQSQAQAQAQDVNQDIAINTNGQCREENHVATSDNGNGTITIRFRLVQINDVYLLTNLPRLATFLRDHIGLPDSMSDATGKNQPHRETTSTSTETIHTTTVITVSGDFLAPSLLSSLDGGSGMVDVLHALGVTHVSLGNHEDDVPAEALRRHIEGNKFEWVNTNLRDLDRALDTYTEECSLVEAGDANNKKVVAMLGLLSDDDGLYRPDAFNGATVRLQSPADAIERILQVGSAVQNADLIVPLTHLDMPDDIQLANKFGVGIGENEKGQQKGVFPVIIGGHDHDVFDEVHNGCRILKAGSDAERAAVVEFVWRDVTASSCNGKTNEQITPELSVQWIEAKDYEPHPEVQQLVDDRRRVLHELESARLFRISEMIDTMREHGILQPHDKDEFSTKRNRYRTTGASSAFCSVIRRGLHADCCAINAGGIRGNTDYDVNDDNDNESWFTFADLKSEMPFPDQMGVTEMPGSVLERVIGFSRRASRQEPPEEDSGLLHLCDMVRYTYDDDDEVDGRITEIGGQPFDPDRFYNVALPIALLNGMDNNTPLLEWAKESGLRISEEAGKPVKVIFVETFSLSFWSKLGSFSEMKNSDGIVTRDELENAIATKLGLDCNSADNARYLKFLVDETMAVADVNQSGTIDLASFLAAELTSLYQEAAPSERRSRKTMARPTIFLKKIATRELGRNARQSVVERTVESVKTIVQQRSSCNTSDDSGEDRKSEWHKSITGPNWNNIASMHKP